MPRLIFRYWRQRHKSINYSNKEYTNYTGRLIFNINGNMLIFVHDCSFILLTHIEQDPLRVSSAPSNSKVLTSETTAA